MLAQQCLIGFDRVNFADFDANHFLHYLHAQYNLYCKFMIAG